MTRTQLILIATLGSALLLGGAYAFQHIGGLLPCKMCLWQRWPHAAAIVIGGLLLLGAPRGCAWLGAAAAFSTGAIGAYHAGVEWGWWPGPASCTGGGMDLSALSGSELLSTTAPSGLVMCDDIAWSLLGLSMAGWNAVFAFALTVIWVTAARRA